LKVPTPDKRGSTARMALPVGHVFSPEAPDRLITSDSALQSSHGHVRMELAYFYPQTTVKGQVQG